MDFKRTACIFLLLMAALPAQAAERSSPVSAQARVLRDRVRIGDELRLLLQVEHPRKYTVSPPDAKTSLAPFEIKGIAPVADRKGQNRVQQTFRLTLTVFQTGDLEVPPITVRFTDDEGRPGSVSTEPVPVKVMSVGKKLTDKDDIRPIKGPASADISKFWTGLAGLLAALLAVLLAVKVTVRKLKERKDLESRKPAHERVKIELARLKDKGFLEEKDYKSFYSGLSDILRRYIERRFGLEAMELTTSELLTSLESALRDDVLRKEMREVLEQSDLVKFAKMVPGYELAGRLETLILDVADKTKPVPEAKRR